MCGLCWLSVRWQESCSDFRCVIQMYSSFADHWRACVLDSSLRSAYWNFQVGLRWPPGGLFGSARSSGMPGIGETMRGASLGCMLLLSLECRGCPHCQPRVLDQITVWGNIFPGSLCTSHVVDRQLVVFDWVVFEKYFQTFEYQICSYPPKKMRNRSLGVTKGDVLSVIPGLVMMGPSHAAQFQLFKISWRRALEAFIC